MHISESQPTSPKRTGVLIIAQHYPPENVMAATRPSKLKHYLETLGFPVFILTLKEKYINQAADSNGTSIATRNVYRCSKLLDINSLFLKLRSFSARNNHATPSANSLSNNQIIPSWKENQATKTIVRYLESLIIGFIDRDKQWILPALLKGASLLTNFGLNAIITTGPPHSTHLIGLFLKACYGVNWIVDFRDPWFISSKLPDERCWLSEKLETFAINTVFKHADSIVTVTQEYAEYLSTNHSFISRDKIFTITNGYDPAEIDTYCTNVQKQIQFTISHIGSLYSNRSPEILFQTVGELLEENKVDKNRLTVNLIGYFDAKQRAFTTHLIRKYNLADQITVTGQLVKAEALREMARSDALLCIAPNQFFQIPGKLFEYLASGSKVITITDNGATKHLMSLFPSHYCISNDDNQKLKEVIHHIYLDKLHSTSLSLLNQPTHIDFISYPTLAKRYAALITNHRST